MAIARDSNNTNILFASTTSGTTVAGSPNWPVNTGDVIVIGTTFDNTGTSTPTVTASNSGTASITWTTQVTANSVSATSGAACRVALITGVVTSGTLQTSDTVTLTYSASITAKAGRLNVFTGVDTTTPVVAGSTNTANGTSTTPSVTTGNSAATGQCVIGVIGTESNTIPASGAIDSDTTNGSWASGGGYNTASGGSTANVAGAFQRKIVTGAGTQTFNLTITSADWAAAIMTLAEATGGAAASDAPSNATRRQLPLLVR